MRAIVLAMAAVLGAGPASQTQSAPPGTCAGVNVLTPAEKAAGWRLLFDGTSKAGWHAYNGRSDEFWTIADCSLKTVGTAGNYGADTRVDLVTDREYTNFELSLDWKGSTGGNSGVMYGVVEDPKYPTAWLTGPEYQLLDDAGFPRKVAPDQRTGANYGMQAPDESKKRLKPVGEWNTTRIVVNGAHVEHWLNGVTILAVERWTPEWTRARDSGKWKDAPDYGKAATGHIAIQDHGSVFWFRNVKIRPMP